MWGKGMSSVAAVVQAKMLGNSALLLLLLVVHPLPQCDYIAGHDSWVQGSSAVVPRRLTVPGGAKPEPLELSQSHLSILLFNWVNRTLSDCRERQVSRSDLHIPPLSCQVMSAYGRFSKGAKPGQPLVWQLLSVFRYDLAVQIAYTFYNTFSDFIQPYLMQRVLRFIDEYLEDSSIGLRFGYFLAAMMLAASVVGTVVGEQQQWQSRGMSMEIRNVLVARLTRKTLRRRANESGCKDGSNKESSDGRVYNIMTADVNRVNKLPEMFGSVLWSPCQIIIGCLYMYRLLGMAGLFGTFMIFGVVAVGQQLIVRAKRIEAQIGRYNDARLETISEIIRGIISVKLFGWGSKFIQLVGVKRAVQLEALWQKSKVWALLNLWTVGMMPVIIFFVLFIYTFTGHLDGETTFTAIAVFRVLQRSIFWMPGGVSHAISIYVSLQRIDKYLHEEDVQPAAERVESVESEVGFDGADLVWQQADSSAMPGDEAQLLLSTAQVEGSQPFTLRNLNVHFPLGKLTIIGGPTGSGKSSLLSALVGEMTLVSGKIHMPMSDTGLTSDIAYVSQEPWLRNATIRDNILFGAPYDLARYEETLRICGLKPDLRVFVAGDLSEVGERGITLSGGQKQRVALARAVYSKRQILLIDDCLSAVDSYTGKHILHECLANKTPLMQGRTRVLVTHHMTMCLPHCQYVVMMRRGKIVAQGTPEQVPGSILDGTTKTGDTESHDMETPVAQGQALNDMMAEDEYNEQRAMLSVTATPGDQ
ncbi:Transporter of the ATP-binding cassette (ABC), partial [Linderina macrospora]